ncbi:hypothetical protein DPMN_087949 [Dreissena polymorpha]|uniref:Uncharacterized protein n=1 Tax=Dreissena polymorpha TaxID=45954 RepID=A0A9D4QWN5_DREPO|nr:hypothetical protein DPMN_087949 [Dreissena polymorpha]
MTDSVRSDVTQLLVSQRQPSSVLGSCLTELLARLGPRHSWRNTAFPGEPDIRTTACKAGVS